MVNYVCPHCKTELKIRNCSNCGAPLGRNKQCPALCREPEKPAPAYEGPPIIGLTHIGRLARGHD